MRPRTNFNRREAGSARLLVIALMTVLGALLLWVLLRDGDRPSTSLPDEGDTDSSTVIQPTGSVADVDRQSREAQVGVVQVFDELTHELLDLPVELKVDGKNYPPLRSGITAELPLLNEDSRLVYRLFDDALNEISAAPRVVYDSNTWKVSIPFYCRVSVRTPQKVLDVISKTSEVGILKVPLTDKRDESIARGSIEELYQRQYADSTFHGMMNRFAHRKDTSIQVTRCLENVIPPVLLAARGHFAVGLALEDGTVGYAPVLLEPGTEVQVEIDLKWRPLITGVLLDWNSEPVPNAAITFTSALDMIDYDLSPRDRVGTAAIRINGVLHQATKGDVKTDENGRFSSVVPRGRDYCVETNALNGRAFWSTRDAGVVLADGESIDIELRLESPDSDHAFVFEVVRADGAPFVGVDAQLGITDDVPYIRQWSKKATDDHGMVRFSGARPGESCRLLLFSASFKGSMYVPDIIVLPQDRRVRVLVPDSAFLE